MRYCEDKKEQPRWKLFIQTFKFKRQYPTIVFRR